MTGSSASADDSPFEQQDFEALYWACISAVSFPLGSLIGIYVPERFLTETVITCLMSFGGGALIFALSIELFGKSIQEHDEGAISAGVVYASMVSAIFGALFFITMNTWMEGHGEGPEEQEHSGVGESKYAADPRAEDSPRVQPTDTDSDYIQTDTDSPRMSPQHSTEPSPRMGDRPDVSAERPDSRQCWQSSAAVSAIPLGQLESVPERLASVPELAASSRNDDVILTPSAVNPSFTSDPVREMPRALVNRRASRRPSLDIHITDLDSAHEWKKEQRKENARARQKSRRGSRITMAQLNHGSSRGIAAAMSATLTHEEAKRLLKQNLGLVDASNPDVPLTPSSQQVCNEIALQTQAPVEGTNGAATAIFLGLAMDAVPEAVVIGILANRNDMSIALVAGVFFANFPEAIATGAMMYKAGKPIWKIVAMWTALCAMTGLIAMLAALVFPRNGGEWVHYVTACAEGLAAGAMLAMIAGTMLPDAYEKGGANLVGLWTVFGFLGVLLVKMLGKHSEDSTSHSILLSCNTSHN